MFRLVLLACLLHCTTNAQAGGSVLLYGVSKHFVSCYEPVCHNGFNERNWGIGLQYGEEFPLKISTYRDSYRKQAVLGTIGYRTHGSFYIGADAGYMRGSMV